MKDSAEWDELYYKKARLAFPVLLAITGVFMVLSLISFYTGLVWGILVYLPLFFLSLFLLGFTYSHHAGIAWWRDRINRRETAVQEYAFNIEADAHSIGLEPVAKVEFRRKAL
jgi:hypothetical protein